MHKIINFFSHNDESGKLFSFESKKNIPFDVKRIYTISSTHSLRPRGFHAHKSLQQVIVAINGSVDFILDDGSSRDTVTLDDPSKGLFISGLLWREMINFKDGCILIILCDDYYNNQDYIRDYDEFLQMSNAGLKIK